jgi:hypothetical protein
MKIPFESGDNLSTWTGGKHHDFESRPSMVMWARVKMPFSTEMEYGSIPPARDLPTFSFHFSRFILGCSPKKLRRKASKTMAHSYRLSNIMTSKAPGAARLLHM